MQAPGIRQEVWARLAMELDSSNWTETFIPPDSPRKDTLHRYAQEGLLVYLGPYQGEGIFVLGDRTSHLFAPTLTTLRLLASTGLGNWDDHRPFREFRESFAFAPDESSRRWVQTMWENWHLQHLHRPLRAQQSFSYLLETCPSDL